MEFPPNPRKLKRNDVVHPRQNGFFYGRVWRRLDENHVVVICCGKYVLAYHEDELVLSDYTGDWEWLKHPGNEYGNTPRWNRMTSLKKLKKNARNYNASFGGRGRWGKWSKEQQKEALANPQRWVTRN